VPPGLAGGAEVLDELLVAQPLETVRGKLTEDPDSIKFIKSTKLMESAFVPRTDKVRGFVYEVETGRLREVG
jgi:hypothetical protein